MSRGSRIVGFGSAALLVVVGGVCAVVLSGLASDLALGVMGVGVVAAVSLGFLEVGFWEDRDRAREEAAQRRERDLAAGKPTRPPARRSRLERMRGHNRRPG